MEPWNDKDFMEWAFGKQEVNLGLDGYHRILDKLYETYLHIKEGKKIMLRLENQMEINLTEEERDLLFDICDREKRYIVDQIVTTFHTVMETDEENIKSIMSKLKVRIDED